MTSARTHRTTTDHRRSVAGQTLGEEAPVDREAQHLGRSPGNRPRSEGRSPRTTLKSDDQPEHEGHGDRRQHQRKRYKAQYLPEGSAVDASCFEGRPRANFSRPVSISRKTNGVQCHTSTTITAGRASAVLPSQSATGRENHARIWLMTPKSKLYISFQIAPMTMAGHQNGQDEKRRDRRRAPRRILVVASARGKAKRHLHGNRHACENEGITDTGCKETILGHPEIVRQPDPAPLGFFRDARRCRGSSSPPRLKVGRMATPANSTQRRRERDPAPGANRISCARPARQVRTRGSTDVAATSCP